MKAIALALVASTLTVPARADMLESALARTRAACAQSGGTLTVPDGALTLADLTGDGTADDGIVSEQGIVCGSDASYVGGSGGFALHTVVGDVVQDWFAGAWLVQDVAFTVEGEVQAPVRMLLLALGGSACGSVGAAPCLQAVTWDGTRMISAKDEADLSGGTEPTR